MSATGPLHHRPDPSTPAHVQRHMSQGFCLRVLKASETAQSWLWPPRSWLTQSRNRRCANCHSCHTAIPGRVRRGRRADPRGHLWGCVLPGARGAHAAPSQVVARAQPAEGLQLLRGGWRAPGHPAGSCSVGAVAHHGFSLAAARQGGKPQPRNAGVLAPAVCCAPHETSPPS